MNYVDYSASLIDIDDFYAKIALIAHNCYQTVGKTSDDIFIANLIKNRHLAMTEHYHFHFAVNAMLGRLFIAFNNPFIVISPISTGYLLTMSIRPILEHAFEQPALFDALIAALPDNIRCLCGQNAASSKGAKLIKLTDLVQTDYLNVYKTHEFISCLVVTDRGVTHELVRHRLCSFAQESTRYCNYAKNKFSHSLTFIRPLDYERYKKIYDRGYQEAEDGYFAMLDAGATPDVARALLPNGLKTSIVITASVEEWLHIYALRLDPAAHKDMRYTMQQVQRALKEKIHE